MAIETEWQERKRKESCSNTKDRYTKFIGYREQTITSIKTEQG